MSKQAALTTIEQFVERQRAQIDTDSDVNAATSQPKPRRSVNVRPQRGGLSRKGWCAMLGCSGIVILVGLAMGYVLSGMPELPVNRSSSMVEAKQSVDRLRIDYELRQH
jgi:hypothetical protein